MITSYDVGDRVRLGNPSTSPDSAAFADVDGVPRDPTEVALTVVAPGGATTVYRWPTPGAGEAALTREAAGRFSADVALDAAGLWRYALAGTGLVVASEERTLHVRASAVVAAAPVGVAPPPDLLALHAAAADPHPGYLLEAAAAGLYLTPAAADALFLTPAEGDALFLTQAEGDARYALAGSGTSIAQAGGTVAVGAGGAISLAPLSGQHTVVANGQVRAPAGTVGAPSYAFAGSTGNGVYLDSGASVDIAVGGIRIVSVQQNSCAILRDGYTLAMGTSGDLTLTRDAADVLAQRRSTNPQTFRLYYTYTDASNYERGYLRCASNRFEVGTEQAGTGVSRNLAFVSNSAVTFDVLGAQRLNVINTGMFPQTADVYDLGTVTNRFQDAFLARNLLLGPGASLGGGARVVALLNATTVPTTNPTGGGVLYVTGGALTYRGSSGTVTTLAPA
jgi:hypothetical protein